MYTVHILGFIESFSFLDSGYENIYMQEVLVAGNNCDTRTGEKEMINVGIICMKIVHSSCKHLFFTSLLR